MDCDGRKPLDLTNEMSVKERISKFDEYHGASIIDGSWQYFEDGASRNAGWEANGALRPPSTDPHELAQQIGVYWQFMLNYAVRLFDDLKHNLATGANVMRQGNMHAPPDDTLLNQLQELKSEVVRCRAGLDAAEKEIEATIPESVHQRQKEKEARMQAGAEFASKLKKIVI